LPDIFLYLRSLKGSQTSDRDTAPGECVRLLKAEGAGVRGCLQFERRGSLGDLAETTTFPK